MLVKWLFYNEQEVAMAGAWGSEIFAIAIKVSYCTCGPDSACRERENLLLNRGLSGRRLGGGMTLFTQFGLEGFGRESGFCPE